MDCARCLTVSHSGLKDSNKSVVFVVTYTSAFECLLGKRFVEDVSQQEFTTGSDWTHAYNDVFTHWFRFLTVGCECTARPSLSVSLAVISFLINRRSLVTSPSREVFIQANCKSSLAR